MPSPENEQFLPGQTEQLAQLTPMTSTVLPFTAAESHMVTAGPKPGLTAQRMFDWLGGQLTI